MADHPDLGTHVEAANKFKAGIDKVTDVLLLLVMKFGRATTMLLAIGVLLIICLVTLIISTVQIATLRSEVRDLLDRQEEFSKSQQRIEATTSTTQQKIDQTQAKVDTVAESAPKVEVDAKTGKAKLVVPASASSAKPKPVVAKPVTPSAPASSADKPADKYEINLQ